MAVAPEIWSTPTKENKDKTMRLIWGLLAGTTIALGTATAASASNEVPGHEGKTGTVTGMYRTEQDGSDVLVQYRGDFGNDPYLNDGWIKNVFVNADGTTETYLIVHEADPRYTGSVENAIWGEWEIVVHTVSGEGNIANLMQPTNAS
jgi:hypothetical protein